MNVITLDQIDRQILLESEIPLGSNITLISPIIYVDGFTEIVGFAFSDQSSAANGVIIEQGLEATDFPALVPATTLVTTTTFSLTANTIVNNYSQRIVAPFARILYVNGAVAQGEFRIFFDARTL